MRETTDLEAGDKPPSWWQRTFFSLRRYHNYRLLWLGSVSEHMGEWMEMVALTWLVWKFTGSAFLLGLVTFVRLIPMSIFSLIGGVVADRMDRRKLLMMALLGSFFISVSLCILVHTGVVAVWHLLFLSALSGVVTSFNHPARQTILPNVVPREQLMNAISLDTFSVMGTRILGPLLAGYLISLWGVTPVFGTRALGAAAAIFWLSFMQTPATPLAARQQNPLYNLKEGFRFLNDNRLVLSLAALYLIPMFFGWSYQSLLPAFADEVLHAGAKGLGYLHAATGIGSMVSLLILAYLGNFKQQGRMLFVAGIFLGITITLFSGSHWFLISSVLLVITGSFNTTFYTVNNTLIQGLVPDELRGRVMSLREMAMGTGAPIGGLLIGFMANHTSVTLATAIFGLACTLVVFVLAQLLPEVRKLTTR